MPTPEEEAQAVQAAQMGEILELPAVAEGGPAVLTPEPAPVLAPAPAPEPAPVAVPEPTPAPVPEPGPTAAEKLAAENALLREELNKQARQFGQPAPTVPLVVTPPAPILSPTPTPAGPIDFVTQEEAESLIDKPKDVLNAVLNKVFQAGREQAMREMPTLVRQQTLTEMSIQQRVQKFWTENEDLEPYRDFCVMVANQVEVENPSLAFDAVLEKTGTVARERLNLPKVPITAATPEPAPMPTPSPTPSANPALPVGSRSARRPAAEPAIVYQQAKEMEDILNL